jgi:hypothetical protein
MRCAALLVAIFDAAVPLPSSVLGAWACPAVALTALLALCFAGNGSAAQLVVRGVCSLIVATLLRIDAFGVALGHPTLDVNMPSSVWVFAAVHVVVFAAAERGNDDPSSRRLALLWALALLIAPTITVARNELLRRKTRRFVATCVEQPGPSGDEHGLASVRGVPLTWTHEPMVVDGRSYGVRWGDASVDGSRYLVAHTDGAPDDLEREALRRLGLNAATLRIRALAPLEGPYAARAFELDRPRAIGIRVDGRFRSIAIVVPPVSSSEDVPQLWRSLATTSFFGSIRFRSEFAYSPPFASPWLWREILEQQEQLADEDD